MKRSLVALLTRRLIVVGAVLTLINVAMVTAYYSLDRENLKREKVFGQIERLAHALSRGLDGQLRFSPPTSFTADITAHPNAYGYRIVDDGGVVVSEANVALVPHDHSATVDGPDMWLSTRDRDGRVALVGSRRIDVQGRPVRITFAASGDPSRLVLSVYFDELYVHVLVALLPFAACLLLVNVVTVRQSMRPLVSAARAARRAGPGGLGLGIMTMPTAGLPSEVSDLVDAINGALRRLGEALEAERAFTAEAAHALRTPLAVLAARIERLPATPAGNDIRQDVVSLARLVEQMLSAAQADTLVITPDDVCDLAEVAFGVVADMAPMAIGLNRELAFHGPSTVPVNGNPDAIAHALRNLIDNGLRSTPPGGEVIVEVVADGTLVVRDRGPGFVRLPDATSLKRFWGGTASDRGVTGLGLSIVRRIAESHGARLRFENNQGGGAVVMVKFRQGGSRLQYSTV